MFPLRTARKFTAKLKNLYFYKHHAMNTKCNPTGCAEGCSVSYCACIFIYFQIALNYHNLEYDTIGTTIGRAIILVSYGMTPLVSFDTYTFKKQEKQSSFCMLYNYSCIYICLCKIKKKWYVYKSFLVDELSQSIIRLAKTVFVYFLDV